MQDKYGISAESTADTSRPGLGQEGQDGLSESSSSSDEDEDEDGILALGDLDERVHNTLEAIRNKDPRVYDTNTKFFDDPDENSTAATEKTGKQEKPVYLNDYHRRILLDGRAGMDDDEDPLPAKTYQQQQDDLKNSIVKEMHATIDDVASEAGSDHSNKGDFLVKKVVQSQARLPARNTKSEMTVLDVASADQDPEAYLSNFMSTKGWVTGDDSALQPFESDDEEQDRQAEAFEEAYNLRFEDPKVANEKLLSHARDAAAKYSVRKEEINPRKRKRESERERRMAEKELRTEEKARLRKLKVADIQSKMEKIKDAAGLNDEDLPEYEWSALLGNAWDDEEWEREMSKRFGDAYYQTQDAEGGEEDEKTKNKKLKKPKWKDEIDINDLVPDFEADNNVQDPPFGLSDTDVEIGNRHDSKDSKSTKLKVERERKNGLRAERRQIENLVEEQLDVNETLANYGKKHAGTFRYRDTSPLTHGLTANDILMAEDSQLNQFVGLKKLAAFRESDKKKKDKKHLGKKQRLKQWRKETFGHEDGPTKTLAEVLTSRGSRIDRKGIESHGKSNIREGKRKNKGSKKPEESQVGG